MFRRRMTVLTLSVCIPLLLIFLLFMAASAGGAVQAAPVGTVVVDTLDDEDDGSCDVGDCSLREAIDAAVDGDTITFNVVGTIVLSPILGDLEIDENLTIDGEGEIKVSGDNAVRVFNVKSGEVTLEGLTIADGNVQTDDCAGAVGKCGGGIILQDKDVSVTLINSTLSSNTAAKNGGGILNVGTLTIVSSTLSGNSSGFLGGGIHNRSSGIVTVNHSTISGNTAVINGGGINNNLLGNLTVNNSTFTANWSPIGGGIYNFGTVTINSSTLSGNRATSHGAGISNYAVVTLNNSTLSGNRAGIGGGGISSNGKAGVFTIINGSIVSGNVMSSTLTADDLALLGSIDSFTSGGHNLIGAIGADITFAGPGDQTGVNEPLLGALADNGGETMTQALLPGSPALDAGDACGTSDQRDIARPQGGACDVGAFESQGFIFTLTSGSPQTVLINTPFANPLALTVSSDVDEPVEGGQVTFSAPASGASVTFTETVEAIAGGGLVSLPVTANGAAGAYVVTADAAGNSGVGLTYSLSNVLTIEHPIHLLSVVKDGSGSGTVSSSPGGINCGGDCSESYNEGTVVTLTAVASPGSIFSGWSDGGCSGEPVCLVTMDDPKDVVASFTAVAYDVFLPVVIE